MKKLMDSFMNEHENGFMDHFKKHKERVLNDREDYKLLINEKNRIMQENSEIEQFLEYGECVDMTKAEKNLILRVLDIEDSIKKIEYKEIFKLGFKEAYIFFEEMEMLNI